MRYAIPITLTYEADSPRDALRKVETDLLSLQLGDDFSGFSLAGCADITEEEE